MPCPVFVARKIGDGEDSEGKVDVHGRDGNPLPRKSGYKLPPTMIRDKLISQESRRAKALQEQKRRRAQKIDATRQLDTFAGLNLGGTDDEDDAEDEESLQPSPASVAQYASMLGAQDDIPNAITLSDKVASPVSARDPISFAEEQETELKKKSKKRKNKRRTNKPSKWADKCMYAELLEMVSDDMWSQGTLTGDEQHYNNGLPKDLESAWIALAPVPAGKRCLAVTYQSAGVAGVVPNTTLRSRLLGKTLIQRFPAPLPPLTILDCILDVNWRDNGILHVLDVVKWKGQDIGDCEARFRFWWRDTRLAELTQMLPPTVTHSRSHFVSVHSQNQVGQHTSLKYRFPYPTTFIPVPYHSTTSLTALDEVVIPASRTAREVVVVVPSPPTPLDADSEGNASMEVEPTSIPSTDNPQRFPESLIYSTALSPFASPPCPLPQTFRARILPDGLLLYVAEASYEPGTSPLSNWVPISSFEQKTYSSSEHTWEPDNDTAKESPLDLFQRIIKQQLGYRMAMRLCSFGQMPESTSSDGLVNETYMDI